MSSSFANKEGSGYQMLLSSNAIARNVRFAKAIYLNLLYVNLDVIIILAMTERTSTSRIHIFIQVYGLPLNSSVYPTLFLSGSLQKTPQFIVLPQANASPLPL